MHATSMKPAVTTAPNQLQNHREQTALVNQPSTLARTRIHPERVSVERTVISREEALRQAILRTG